MRRACESQLRAALAGNLDDCLQVWPKIPTGRICHGGAPTLVDLCLIGQIMGARGFLVDMSDLPTISRRIAQSSLKLDFCAGAPRPPAGRPHYTLNISPTTDSDGAIAICCLAVRLRMEFELPYHRDGRREQSASVSVLCRQSRHQLLESTTAEIHPEPRFNMSTLGLAATERPKAE